MVVLVNEVVIDVITDNPFLTVCARLGPIIEAVEKLFAFVAPKRSEHDFFLPQDRAQRLLFQFRFDVDEFSLFPTAFAPHDHKPEVYHV